MTGFIIFPSYIGMRALVNILDSMPQECAEVKRESRTSDNERDVEVEKGTDDKVERETEG